MSGPTGAMARAVPDDTPKRRRRIHAIVVACGVAVGASISPAHGADIRLQQDAAGVRIAFEDMAIAEIVRQIGARLGFRVVDRAPRGPHVTRSLRAPSWVALLNQLLAPGSYIVEYRGGPGQRQVIDKVVLLPAARSRTDEAAPVDTPPLALSRDDAEQAHVVTWPHEIGDSERHAVSDRWARETAVLNGSRTALSTPQGRPVEGPSGPPIGARANVRQEATIPASAVVPEDVRRFIFDRLDVLVDATRETTLTRPGGR